MSHSLKNRIETLIRDRTVAPYMREPTRACYALCRREWEVIEKKTTPITLHDDWMENRTRLYVQGSYKMRTAIRRNESEAAQKFNQLAQRWYRETGMLSFIRQ